jgi:hypothetical protein
MSIGLVTANSLPSVYDRKALEDEEMMLISVGRTKLKVPFDTFGAVSNALSTFAPDGKPTMEPGWTITLKDEFSGRSTSVTASTLLSVMQALATFSVKKGIYIPEIPPIEEPEPVTQTKAVAKKPGRKKAAPADEKGAHTAISAEAVEEAPRSSRKVKAATNDAVEEAPTAETIPETPKPSRKKSDRVAKAEQDGVESQAAPANEPDQAKPEPTTRKPRKVRAARQQDVAPPEVTAETRETPAVSPPKKSGRRKAETVEAKTRRADDAGNKSLEVIADVPPVEQRAAKAEPEKKLRKTRGIEAATVTSAAETTASDGGSSDPLTVPDYEGGPLAKALVPDHAKPEAPVKGEGIPSYMADYKMAYILDGGEYRFDFTPLQINPKSKRKVLGVPTDPNATTVPGYEIKSNGDHVGWIIVEEKMLFALGLPNSRDGNQAAANGSVAGIVRKILFGVVPAVDKIRRAA